VPLTAAVAVVLDELRRAHAGDVPAAATQDDAAAPRGHESEADGAAVHTSSAHQPQDAGAART
jgi:hypothetical protein